MQKQDKPENPKYLRCMVILLSKVAWFLAVIQLMAGLWLLIYVGMGILHIALAVFPAISMIITGILGQCILFIPFYFGHNNLFKSIQNMFNALATVMLTCSTFNMISGIVVLLFMIITRGSVNVLENRITSEVHEYNQNMNKKMSIDDLQVLFHCCGARAYSDYFIMHWTENYTDIGHQVPVSCCNPNVLNPCMQMDLMYEGEETIFQKGCAVSLSSKRAYVGFFLGLLFSVTGITQGLLIYHLHRIHSIYPALLGQQRNSLGERRGTREIENCHKYRRLSDVSRPFYELYGGWNEENEGNDVKLEDVKQFDNKRQTYRLPSSNKNIMTKLRGIYKTVVKDEGKDEELENVKVVDNQSAIQTSAGYILPTRHEQHIIMHKDLIKKLKVIYDVPSNSNILE